jgi:hypothetical protein
LTPWIIAIHDLQAIEPKLRNQFSLKCDGVPAVRRGVWAMLESLAALHEAVQTIPVRWIHPAQYLNGGSCSWMYPIDTDTMCLVEAMKNIMNWRIASLPGVPLCSH